MSARPLFGLIACTLPDPVAPGQMLTDRYMEAAVRHADAAALIIPARPDLVSPSEAAARIDGLLLTGSPSNVAPSRYGEPDTAGNGPFDPARDAMTAGLIAAMIALGKPVLGICRGFQEMNVAFGGTLRRDLGEADRPLPHHSPSGTPVAASFDHFHPVALTPGGVLAAGLGRNSLQVRSVHYQGVDRLGRGLRVEATAPDGVIEAASAVIDGAQLLGVQWHPEWGADADPPSRTIFAMFGRALRGAAMAGQ